MSSAVLGWQDEPDFTNTPEIKEAWLEQFCNMQSEMQTGIKFVPFSDAAFAWLQEECGN